MLVFLFVSIYIYIKCTQNNRVAKQVEWSRQRRLDDHLLGVANKRRRWSKLATRVQVLALDLRQISNRTWLLTNYNYIKQELEKKRKKYFSMKKKIDFRHFLQEFFNDKVNKVLFIQAIGL